LDDLTVYAIDTSTTTYTSLLINTGVEVLLGTDVSLVISGYRYSSSRYNWGVLQARNVTFSSHSLSPQPGDWQYIKFENYAKDYNAADSTGCFLDGCIIEYAGADSIASVWSYESTPLIKDCTIRNGSGNGIQLYSSSPQIIGTNVINHSKNGIYGTNSSNAVIDSCLVNTCDLNGIYFENSSLAIDN